ncbi:MAG: mandelate racemase/muconate lactonizing enzyme family protein [Phycisphaeraceae bacterium]|nr:mandelate racemase/muconate lactonizing enzyme family protein [Phycisphaeraceae bacterium]
MKITSLDTFILHVPVTRRAIADSTHQVTHWAAPGVMLHTDQGITGFGYSGTHAHLPADRLITECIRACFGPLLTGQDPTQVRSLWSKLVHHPPLQWVGRGGITHLALGAIDIALWDIKAKAAGVPLWRLLGGSDQKRIEGYNTDGGWLNWDDQTLVSDCRRLVEVEGFRGVKIKVGSADYRRDLDRVEMVRKTIGFNTRLMVDANGRWDLPTALQAGSRFQQFDVTWFEEPIWYDDVEGHRRLAESIATPLALGEQLYLLDHFRQFITCGAVHYVQPDVTRVAGVTEWWQVAELALAHRLPVVSHIGDMMQVHLHTALAHRSCTMLEYIPWLRSCFQEPATIEDGCFICPKLPGAGTTLREDAIERYGVR